MKDVMRGILILVLGLFAIAGHAEDVLMNEDCFHYWIVSSGTVEERRQLGLGDELDYQSLKLTRQDLSRYIDELAQGGVTHFLMNVNGQKAMYPSKALEPVWSSLDNAELKHPAWVVALKDLYARGIDPYAVWIARCREKGLVPWVSVRMNDLHLVVDPKSGFVSEFWRQHPQWRVDPKAKWNEGTDNIFRDWGKCAWLDGLDFTVPEVRARMLGFIRELLARYDADGIELDLLRGPNYLPKGRERETASVFTAFMREVSASVRAAAKARKHPIVCAVRVLTRPEESEKRGLEVATWAKEGLIDAVIPCNFYVDIDFGIPVQEWRALMGDRVKIYPGADSGRVVNGRRRLMRPEDYREWSAGLRGKGGDGFYLFNLFLVEKPTWNHVLKHGLD